MVLEEVPAGKNLKTNSVFNTLPSDSQTVQLMKWLGISIRLLLGSLLVSIIVAQVLVGICALLWIMLMLKGAKYRRTILDIPLLLYIVCRLISIIFSSHIHISVVSISRELIFYVSYFFTAFYIEYSSEEELTSLLRWLFYPTALVTIYAVGEFLMGFVDRERALSGGGTISAHLTISMVALLISRDRKDLFQSTLYWWGLIIVFTLGIVFSLTRGDWIATATVSTLYGWVFNKKLLFGLLIIGAILAFSFPTVRDRLVTLGSPWGNSSDRLTIWKEARVHAGEHPLLGFGPETFPVVFSNWKEMGDRHVGSWHNDFIQQYMESGILGVVSWLGVLGSFLYASWKSLTGGIPECFRMGWMGLLLIIAYLITGFFSIPTFSITNAMVFRFMLAVVAIEYSRIKLPKIIR